MAAQDSRKCLVCSLTCSQIGFFPLLDGMVASSRKIERKKEREF
jgi:hypothetical protein